MRINKTITLNGKSRNEKKRKEKSKGHCRIFQPKQTHLVKLNKKLAYADQKCLALIFAVIAKIRDEWRECKALCRKRLAHCNYPTFSRTRLLSLLHI